MQSTMIKTAPAMQKSLTIGVLAERARVGVETIRFYERKGLIEQPVRPLGGVRIYPQTTIRRIEFIHHAQELGFTLREIQELLALQKNPVADCAAVQGRAVGKLAEIEVKLSQILRMRATLRNLVAHCPGQGNLDSCNIVGALSSTQTPHTTPAHLSSPGDSIMKSISLSVEGMHCQGCAKTIEALLATEMGIKSAQVSHADGKATVFYDPAAIDALKITAAIERAGYVVMAGA